MLDTTISTEGNQVLLIPPTAEALKAQAIQRQKEIDEITATHKNLDQINSNRKTYYIKHGKPVAHPRAIPLPKKKVARLPTFKEISDGIEKDYQHLVKVKRAAIGTFEQAKPLVWHMADYLATKERFKFDIDEDNYELFTNLIKYFFNIPDGLFDIDAGILIIGDTGVGKDFAIKVFYELMIRQKQNKFLRKHATEFASMIESGTSINRWFINDLWIQDLGIEPLIHKAYGNEKQILEKLIFGRDNKFDERPWRTIITSNLLLSDIKQTYGKRTYSRILRLCTPYHLKGPDRRIKSRKQ